MSWGETAANVVQGIGAMRQGKAAKQAAFAEAAQMDQQARQTRAVGTFNSDRIRRRAQEIMATQRAAMASSGGSASGDDGTSAAIITETSRKASMEQLLIQAQAEDEAKGIEYGATLRRRGGKMAQQAANWQAAGSFLKAAGSWADAYGGGGGKIGTKNATGGGRSYGPPV